MLNKSNVFKSMIALVLGFVLFVLFRAIHQDPYFISSTMIGRPMPLFSLPELSNGKSLVRQSLFLHKNSILYVFDPACKDCIKYFPQLNNVLARCGVASFALLEGGNLKSANHFSLKIKNMFQTVIVDSNYKLFDLLGVSKLPTVFLVDQSGVVRSMVEPSVQNNTWKQVVQKK